MKKRTLLSLIAAVAVCIMLGTPAFAKKPSPYDCPFGEGMCGNAPLEDALVMPSTAPYYPSLDEPCEMIADHTAIFFQTDEATIKSLLPPNVTYIPVELNLRNIYGVPAEVFEVICAMPLEEGGLGGGTINQWGECNVKPFGDAYVMILSLLDYVETSCYGPYREVLILIPSLASDPDKKFHPYSEDPAYWQYHYDYGDAHVGLYNPYLWLSSDAPIAAGREIWGFPKKMADSTFVDTVIDGTDIPYMRTWTVSRSLSSSVSDQVGGDHLPILHQETQTDPIISATIIWDPTAPFHPDAVRFPPLYQTKIIPNVDGVTADIKQLNLVPLDPQTSGVTGQGENVFPGMAFITLHGGPDDPVDDIVVDRVLLGFQFRYNFELSSGRTLTDYLETEDEQ
jgi:acetoacetate decarboxylase